MSENSEIRQGWRREIACFVAPLLFVIKEQEPSENNWKQIVWVIQNYFRFYDLKNENESVEFSAFWGVALNRSVQNIRLVTNLVQYVLWRKQLLSKKSLFLQTHANWNSMLREC